MASGNRVRNRAGRNRLSSQGTSLLGDRYRRLCRIEPLEQRRLLSVNADWTVLIYVAADNELDDYALLDIKEMEVFGSSDDVNIVVQWDGDGNGDYGEEEGTRRGKIIQDDDPDDVNSPFYNFGASPEYNMGDPAVFQDFIEWGVKHTGYKADHYALILWDHGDPLKHGVCKDDTSGGDWLTLGELNGALHDARENLLGLEEPIDMHFDLIGFNTCVMASLEVAHEIGDYADVMVASQNLIDADPSWDYEAVVGALVSSSAAEQPLSPEQLGITIADSYADQDPVESIAQSVVDLRTLKQAEANFFDSLNGFAAEVRRSATSADLSELDSCEYHTPFFYDPRYRDLGIFLEKVVANDDISTVIRDAAQVTYMAYQESIIYNIFDVREGSEIISSGLSSCLDFSSVAFDVEDYQEKAPGICNSTFWDDFLDWWTDDGTWAGIPSNQQPTATADSFSVNEETQLVDNLSGSDPESDSLTYWLYGDAEHGTVVIDHSSGAFTYMPDRDFYGTDTFQFVVHDGGTYSSPATVTVTVNPMPDGPNVMKVEVGNASGMIEVETGIYYEQLIPVHPMQLIPLKFDGGIDRVRITFNEPIDRGTAEDIATKNALTLVDRRYDDCYTASEVAFSGDNKQVTWTLSGGPLMAGEMILTISDGVRSNGCAIDGEWTSPTTFGDTTDNSTFDGGQVSGDEVPGGDFVFNFTMPNTRFGDADRNGKVDFEDYLIIIDNWCQSGKSWTDGDFTGDGIVGGEDVLYWVLNDGYNVWMPYAFAASFDTAGGGTLNDELAGLGEDIEFERLEDASHGTATVNTDGTFSYTPTLGHCGLDTFTYQVYNETECSEPATVTVYVDAPVVVGVTVRNSATQQAVTVPTASDGYDQLLPLPYLDDVYNTPADLSDDTPMLFEGFDQVVIEFDKPVVAVAADLTISDLQENTYNAASCSTDGSTVTWTFSSGPDDGKFRYDEMIITLSDAVTAEGMALDGEWTSPEYFGDTTDNSTFAGGLSSGDGAHGGDFVFNISMLYGGDADCDGDVDSDDMDSWILGILFHAEGPWWYGDFDNDSDVDDDDYDILMANYGTTVWPQMLPLGGGGGGGGEMLSSSSYSTAELDSLDGVPDAFAILDKLFEQYGLTSGDASVASDERDELWDSLRDDFRTSFEQLTAASDATTASDKLLLLHENLDVLLESMLQPA